MTEFRGDPGEGLVDAVVVSHEDAGVRSLVSIRLEPFASVQIPNRTKGTSVVLKSNSESDWGAAFVPEKFKRSIDISLAQRMLGKEAARDLLSGHLITYFYHPLQVLKLDTRYIDVSSRWEREMKYLLSDGETTLTKFTAQVYSALTNWLESAPAQLIAIYEGVSVSTIRNRLNAAREQGFIEKPGAGIRSSKSRKEKVD
jgi:hypothetical protein